jgi:hypothetical protein
VQAVQNGTLADGQKRERRLEQNRQAAKRSYNKRIATQNEMTVVRGFSNSFCSYCSRAHLCVPLTQHVTPSQAYECLQKDMDWTKKRIAMLLQMVGHVPSVREQPEFPPELRKLWPQPTTQEQLTAIKRIHEAVQAECVMQFCLLCSPRADTRPHVERFPREGCFRGQLLVACRGKDSLGEVLSNVIISVLDVVASQPSSAATNTTADGAGAAAPDKDGT